MVDIEGSGRTGVPGVDCAYGLVGCDEEQVIRTDGEDSVEEDGEGTRWCAWGAGVAVPGVLQAEVVRAYVGRFCGSVSILSHSRRPGVRGDEKR